jgi:hypothetical protein
MSSFTTIVAKNAALDLVVILLLTAGSAQISEADPTTQSTGPAPVAPADSILAEYNPQAPPNPNPPPYTLLRFNEDYTYLADPRNRTDLFDPLKYIALNPNDPSSYLSFGGSIRERYEHYTSPGFGVPGQPNQTDDLLQRITLDADLHVNRQLRFFVEGISGLQIGTDTPAPPVQEDTVNLQQAFADLRFDVDGAKQPEYLVVRGGRFEMSAGSGRLIATRDGPNIPFKFDGIELIAAGKDAKVYAFLTKPAREHKYEFDDEYPGQLFWGVYCTTPVLGQLRFARIQQSFDLSGSFTFCNAAPFPLNRRHQAREIPFEQVVTGTGLHRRHGGFHTYRSGHEKQRYIRGKLPRKTQCGGTAEMRQGIVRDDDIPVVFAKGNRHGIGCFHAFMIYQPATAAQLDGEKFRVVFRIFHDENAQDAHATSLVTGGV